MLINLRDICAIAEQKNMAIAAFDTPSLEYTRAAIKAAEDSNFPIILAHAQGHENICPLDVMGPVLMELATQSTALICVDLDHCENLEYMKKALDFGFTGAMYDGSTLSYEENVANARRAKAMIQTYDCALECEIGSMGTRENGLGHENDHIGQAIYTDPQQAAEFIDETNTDILAVSFGTSHGIYKGAPHLNFDILREIRQLREIPLVMHGGSGVSDDDYRRAIDAGIRKVNYFTYGVRAAGRAAADVVRNFDSKYDDPDIYWQDLTDAAYKAFYNDCLHVIDVLSNGASSLN